MPLQGRKTTTLLGMAETQTVGSLLLSFNTDIMEANKKRAMEMGILKQSRKVRGKDEYITMGTLTAFSQVWFKLLQKKV